jgi:HEPN domain-containing protein
VTPRDSARYRLELADSSLRVARESLDRGQWREAALFARAAVENAAKAVQSCFTNVHRTHDPDQPLADALRSPQFPAGLRARAQALLPRLSGFGMKEHIALSYGDEEKGLTPWDLVTEEKARGHLAVAEESAALAHECYAALHPA